MKFLGPCRVGLVLLCLLMGLSVSVSAQSSEPVRVVTSFSILADWAELVGGAEVEVHSLVGLDDDVHAFNPAPRDLAKVAQADLLLINGLGLEGWIQRLVMSSGFRGRLVEASRGVPVIEMGTESEVEHDHAAHDHHQHGDQDPHAWLSLRAAQRYVNNIRDSLIELAPEKADQFRQRSRDYIDQLIALDQQANAKFEAIQPERRQIIVPHNAFAYLARDYDFKVHSLKGLDSSAESSAAALARVIRLSKTNNIKAIFAENISNDRLISRVADEAGVALAGYLVSGSLSATYGDSYLKLMQYNLDLILQNL